MPNYRISLCKHGAHHSNRKCSFAHSFASIMHPIKKAYPSEFWSESVSYFYGQRMSRDQDELIKMYASEERENGLPQWVCEYLELSGQLISDTRGISSLQDELCSLFRCSSVFDIANLNVYKCSSEVGIFERTCPKRARRIEPIRVDDDPSEVSSFCNPVFTTVQAPMAEVCIQMQYRGDFPRVEFPDRFGMHLYSSTGEPFTPVGSVEYTKGDLESIAVNISRLASSGKQYVGITCQEAIIYIPGMYVSEECGLSVFCKEGFGDGSFVHFYGINLQGLLHVIRNENLYGYGSNRAYASMINCLSDEVSIFEYIGNGILVRCHILLKGIAVRDKSYVPLTPKAEIAGYVIEVLSSMSFQRMEHSVPYLVL